MARSERGQRVSGRLFAKPRASFRVIPAAYAPVPTDPRSLSGYSRDLAVVAETHLGPGDAKRLLRKFGAVVDFLNATTDQQRSSILLGESEGDAELRGLLGAVTKTAPDKGPRIRAHQFFRNIQGMWACSAPSCLVVAYATAGRIVLSASCTHSRKIPGHLDA